MIMCGGMFAFGPPSVCRRIRCVLPEDAGMRAAPLKAIGRPANNLYIWRIVGHPALEFLAFGGGSV